MLEATGARAIGTSSAAHAFTLGLPDGGHVSRDDAIAHAVDLGQAVAIPVSADLENGYGASGGDVAATVKMAADAGLAGCCMEDTALPKFTPYPRQEAVHRIEAAVTAARAADVDFFLVARADGVMLGTYDLDEAIARVRAFASAGADGVYIPVLPDLEAVRRVCESVDVPVNVLAVGRLQHHSLAEFGDAGVARVSLGSALARKTHQAIIEGARPIFDEGSFAGLMNGVDDGIVDALLER